MEERLQKILLTVARDAIRYYLRNRKKITISRSDFSMPELWKDRATFVTLTINGQLRGCIGSIIPIQPLIVDISDNAVNAAFRDPRFYPLTERELPFINIEVSILTVPEALEFSSPKEMLGKIRQGIDGVIIKKGFYQATFLPQVWKELPDKRAFFTHLCLKAGLSSNCFRMEGLKVFTYQVEAFSEEDFK